MMVLKGKVVGMITAQRARLGLVAAAITGVVVVPLTLMTGARMLRRLGHWLEPAGSHRLHPPSAQQQPQPSKTSAEDFVNQLTPSWQASSLGNPALGRYPHCWQTLPRTPWDLAIHDGQLYVGLGNSSNDGSTANAGPVPLFAYDIATDHWKQAATLPEEEISRFSTRGSELWIAGADARGSWRWGNLYRSSSADKQWWQERRLPTFIHVHDLAWHGNELVVVGNVPDAATTGPKQERHGSALGRSSDEGRHWLVDRLNGWRAVALLPVDDQLFAVQALPGPAQRRWLASGDRLQGFLAVQQWLPDGIWRPRPDLTAAVLLPGINAPGMRSVWMERATPSNQAVAWIASIGPWKSERPQRAAFLASRFSPAAPDVQQVALPSDEQAMDLISSEEGWLLLSSEKLASGQWLNRIRAISVAGLLKGEQMPSTKPWLSFETPAAAWSLAGDRQRLFVGLGHPPFQQEPSPKHCPAEAKLSGTVLEFRPR